MRSEQSHDMQLETIHPSGAEEWACPKCSRRFVAQWFPIFRRVILEPGEVTIAHKNTGTNLQMQISNEDKSSDGTELGDVWRKLIDKLDFDVDADEGDVSDNGYL